MDKAPTRGSGPDNFTSSTKTRAMNMKATINRSLRIGLVLVLVLWAFRLTGCDYNITGNPVVSLVQVTLSPQTATIGTSSQLALTATIKNYLHDGSVSWEFVGSSVGQIAPSGLTATYTAPAKMTVSPTFVTVLVRSVEDTSQHHQCVITITQGDTSGGNKINVTLTPLSVSLKPGGMQQFNSTVTGTANAGITWKLVSGQGTISQSGLYQAPAAITTSIVTSIIQATAIADNSKWAQATIVIVAPADSTVCFSRDILPMLVSNCSMSGCHDPGERDLTTYAGALRYVRAGNASNSKLYTAVTQVNGDDRMPPAPRSVLSAAQIKLIGQWINEGATNRDCSDTTTTGGGCDTTTVHYAAFVKGVIQNYCLGCHNGATASKGIDLSTIAGVQTYAKNGQLVGSINGSGGLVLMPQSGIKLDNCTIAKITAWVNKGAPND
jgi:hypothetical protein